MRTLPRTREQAIERTADALVKARTACAQMTPREQAEAAYTPTGPPVAELEARIRVRRGLPQAAARAG